MQLAQSAQRAPSPLLLLLIPAQCVPTVQLAGTPLWQGLTRRHYVQNVQWVLTQLSLGLLQMQLAHHAQKAPTLQLQEFLHQHSAPYAWQVHTRQKQGHQPHCSA